MADNDPFGRARGEDSLAGMGWRAAPAPAPEAAPVASPPPARRRRRRGRGLGRMLVSLVFLGAVLAGSFALIGRVSDTVDSVLDTAKQHSQLPAAPVTPTAPVRPPRGLQRGSLLREANLRAALRRLRGEGRLHLLRVAPDRIDPQLTTRRHLVLVDLPAGEAPRRSLTSPLPASAVRPIPFALVDATAPARLARTAARRAHRSVARVNYLVLMRLLGPPQWYLYFTDGVYFSADLHGRHARRVG
jgi:hypothetical protein